MIKQLVCHFEYLSDIEPSLVKIGLVWLYALIYWTKCPVILTILYIRSDKIKADITWFGPVKCTNVQLKSKYLWNPWMILQYYTIFKTLFIGQQHQKEKNALIYTAKEVISVQISVYWKKLIQKQMMKGKLKVCILKDDFSIDLLPSIRVTIHRSATSH